MAHISNLVRGPRRSGKIVFNNLKFKGYVPENDAEISVSNIPPRVDEKNLIAFFARAGEILQFRLMMFEDYTRNKGYCYVVYSNAKSAKIAVDTLGKIDFMKRKLAIEHSMNNCGLFVSGFPTHKIKKQIWEELEKSGFVNIMDVVKYRSYSNRTQNSGVVFVQFRTHEHAANTRARFAHDLKLWGIDVVVDWSLPKPESHKALEKVTVIYMGNLRETQCENDFVSIVTRYVGAGSLPKIYKYENYAFVHLSTRQEAEALMEKLKEHYTDTSVEIEWARTAKRHPLHRLSNISSDEDRSSSSSDSRTSISPVNSTSSSSSSSSSSGTEEGSSESGVPLPPSLPQPINATACHQADIVPAQPVDHHIPVLNEDQFTPEFINQIILDYQKRMAEYVQNDRYVTAKDILECEDVAVSS